MFSIMTEENGEHLKKLPHLCPILCPAMGNNSHECLICAQTARKPWGTNLKKAVSVPNP